MPFCPQCGVDNPDSARFCDQCGAALIPVTAPPVAASAVTVAPVSTPPSAAPVSATPSAGPNICPQCGMSVIPGEAFCDNCGAPLIPAGSTAAPAPAAPFVATVPQQPNYPPPQQVQPVAPVATPPAAPAFTPPPPATPVYTPATPVTPAASGRTILAPSQLIVQSSGAVISLPTQQQVTVGRSDAVSGFFPDIDLSPHGALDGGVGRRHLQLFIQNGQLFAEDLDSTNGSFLNGQKLQPRQPQQLKTNDELRLGKLDLRVQL